MAQFLNEVRYPGTGLEEFSFIDNGKQYTVLPKHGKRDKFEKFFNYVRYIVPKTKGSPWAYRVNSQQDFNKDFIIKVKIGKNTPKLKPSDKSPEIEQMKMDLSASIDRISSKLESEGHIEEAYNLDIISNTLDTSWEGSGATLFFDDVANHDIDSKNALEVLRAYEKGADTEHSVAKVTGIDAWTCKKVLDIANKYNLLN